MNYKTIPSPIGKLNLIATDKGLTAIDWNDSPLNASCKKSPQNPILLEAEKQLNEYFEGKRSTFELPLDPQGTPFQKKVWKGLETIPFGKTWSYKQLAEKIRNNKAFRAVGLANSKNPLPIVIPCHRVIGANGKLTGFTGGLERKSFLLELEQTSL